MNYRATLAALAPLLLGLSSACSRKPSAPAALATPAPETQIAATTPTAPATPKPRLKIAAGPIDSSSTANPGRPGPARDGLELRPIPAAPIPAAPSVAPISLSPTTAPLNLASPGSPPPAPEPTSLDLLPFAPSAAPNEIHLPRAASPPADINSLIVEQARQFRTGGAYASNAVALGKLQDAVSLRDGRLALDESAADPSFCSSATYLLFLKVIDRLQQTRTLQLDSAVLAALLVTGQKDGEGVWGRWNANGPGTARLFHEAGLGRNFQSLAEARPGDFLKIWWSDEIGSRERGHSVVFLGTGTGSDGETYLEYWSSNQSKGYSFARVPLSRARRLLFSRLEHPEKLAEVSSLPPRDSYLAEMLKRPSNEPEMDEKVGLPVARTKAAIERASRPPSSKVKASPTAKSDSERGR